MLPQSITATEAPFGSRSFDFSVPDTRSYIESLGKVATDDEVMFLIGSWAFEEFDGDAYTLVDGVTGELLNFP